jgi:hypothetical protein
VNTIERAEKAQRILNDPIFQESFESVRQALLTKFETAPVNDTEGMAKIRLCLKLLSDVKANLVSVLNDGKVAEFEMQEKKRVANLADYNSNPRFRR